MTYSWEFEDADDLLNCIKEYALERDGLLTEDAREFKQGLLKAIQPALEAQHRKTWDMAIRAVEAFMLRRAQKHGSGGAMHSTLHHWAKDISQLPCPPLTNESTA